MSGGKLLQVLSKCRNPRVRFFNPLYYPAVCKFRCYSKTPQEYMKLNKRQKAFLVFCGLHKRIKDVPDIVTKQYYGQARGIGWIRYCFVLMCLGTIACVILYQYDFYTEVDEEEKWNQLQARREKLRLEREEREAAEKKG